MLEKFVVLAQTISLREIKLQISTQVFVLFILFFFCCCCFKSVMIIAVITVGPAGKPLLFKGARVNAMEMTHQPYLSQKF